MVHYWNESPRVREKRSDIMNVKARSIARKRACLTQHRLAKLAGICASTISLWENYELELAPEAVEKIGRVIAAELDRVPVSSTPRDIVHVLMPSVGNSES
jgi:transcriptional regulator with XRE-family HTH domain